MQQDVVAFGSEDVRRTEEAMNEYVLNVVERSLGGKLDPNVIKLSAELSYELRTKDNCEEKYKLLLRNRKEHIGFVCIGSQLRKTLANFTPKDLVNLHWDSPLGNAARGIYLYDEITNMCTLAHSNMRLRFMVIKYFYDHLITMDTLYQPAHYEATGFHLFQYKGQQQPSGHRPSRDWQPLQRHWKSLKLLYSPGGEVNNVLPLGVVTMCVTNKPPLPSWTLQAPIESVPIGSCKLEVQSVNPFIDRAVTCDLSALCCEKMESLFRPVFESSLVVCDAVKGSQLMRALQILRSKPGCYLHQQDIAVPCTQLINAASREGRYTLPTHGCHFLNVFGVYGTGKEWMGLMRSMEESKRALGMHTVAGFDILIPRGPLLNLFHLPWLYNTMILVRLSVNPIRVLDNSARLGPMSVREWEYAHGESSREEVSAEACEDLLEQCKTLKESRVESEKIASGLGRSKEEMEAFLHCRPYRETVESAGPSLGASGSLQMPVEDDTTVIEMVMNWTDEGVEGRRSASLAEKDELKQLLVFADTLRSVDAPCSSEAQATVDAFLHPSPEPSPAISSSRRRSPRLIMPPPPTTSNYHIRSANDGPVLQTLPTAEVVVVLDRRLFEEHRIEVDKWKKIVEDARTTNEAHRDAVAFLTHRSDSPYEEDSVMSTEYRSCVREVQPQRRVREMFFVTTMHSCDATVAEEWSDQQALECLNKLAFMTSPVTQQVYMMTAGSSNGKLANAIAGRGVRLLEPYDLHDSVKELMEKYSSPSLPS